jgi:hypothetical protein
MQLNWWITARCRVSVRLGLLQAYYDSVKTGQFNACYWHICKYLFYIITALFCVITQRVLVIPYRRFRKLIGVYLETSTRNYHSCCVITGGMQFSYNSLQKPEINFLMRYNLINTPWQATLKAGLIINTNTTKYLYSTRKSNQYNHFTAEGKQLEQVNSFKYLGTVVNTANSIEEEINLLVTRCIKFNIQQLYLLPTLYLFVV